jgi:hypothetical protein
VYLLTTAGVAYDLDDMLPEGTSVYGGAVRSYPPGTGWTTDTRKAMTRLAYTDEEAKAAVGLIVDDVTAMATTFSTSSQPAQAPQPGPSSPAPCPGPDAPSRPQRRHCPHRHFSLRPGVPVSRSRRRKRVTGTIHDGVC